MKAWITYTFQDKNLADKLAKILESANIDVLDNVNEIIPGDNIIETIYNTISSADIIFIILSKNSNESEWLNTEIGMIISEIRNNPHKRIIPVLTKSGTKIPPFIDQYQCVTLENEEDIKLKFENLVNILKTRTTNSIYSNHEKEIIRHNFILSKDELLKKEKIIYEQKQKQKNKILLLTVITTLIITVSTLSMFILIGEDFLFKNIDKRIYHELMTVIASLTTGVCTSLIIFEYLKKK